MVFKMRKVLFWFLASGMFWSVSGKNLLRNSSFELGSAEYSVAAGIPYSAADFTPVRAERDASTRIHGQYSLHFPNPRGNTVQFSSHDVKLIPGRSYVFSCWMKAEKPAVVQLMLRSCTRDAKGYHWWNKATEFQVSPEWRKYTFPIPAIPEANPVGNLVLNWNADSLWLDAMRFAEEPGEYAPAAEVEFAFVRSEPVRHPGENQFAVSAVNYSSRPVERRIVPVLYDLFYRRRETLSPLTFVLEPGESRSLIFPVKLTRYGTFELRMDTGEVPLLFAVIGRLPRKKYSFRDGFSAGVNGHLFHMPATRFQPPEPDGLPREPLFNACGMNLDEFFARTRQAGFGAIRLHDDGLFAWWRIERERGSYDWRATDNVIRRARRNGLDILPRLGSMEFVARDHDKIAGSWLRKASEHTGIRVSGIFQRILPPPDLWEKFVYEFMARYKDDIQCCEIINEPNLFLTPEQYTEYLKRAYRAAKKANPSCTVVGFCATGDLNGDLGRFLEECGSLGAFQYADAVSFHPYNAQLDDAPVPAEQQIRQVAAIVRKYRPGLPVWNSELYFIQDWEGLSKPVAEQSEFPVGNLVRRYLIDLGAGLAQSIPVWAPRMIGVDLRPGYQWTSYAASTFLPNEYAVATNAFARFLECGRGLGKWDLLRGLSLWRYEDRHGNSLLACWALKRGERFTLVLPEGVTAYDLFGNPIPGREILIGGDPVYLKGKEKRPDWNLLKVVPHRKFQVAGARYSRKGGASVLAVEIENNTRENQRPAIRIPGAPAQRLELKPQEIRTVLFPAPAERQEKLRVIVSDGERVQSFFVRPISGRICHTGETLAVGENGKIQVRTTPEFLEFQIQVRDDRRGGRVKDAPWSGDGVEIFLDMEPFRALDREAYTNACFRLFLVPKSSNGLPEALTGSPNLNLEGIVWSLQDAGADFAATTRIPWKNLGRKSPGTLAFDVAVDDSDGERRHSQQCWNGGPENWRNRFLFGLLISGTGGER